MKRTVSVAAFSKSTVWSRWSALLAPNFRRINQ